MLFTLAIKATVVLAAAMLAAAALRRASAATRHIVWACALAGLLAAPLLEWSGVKVAVPLPASAPIFSNAETVETVSGGNIISVTPRSSQFNWTLLWYAGAGLVSLRLVIAFMRLRRLKQSTTVPAWADKFGTHNARIRESGEIDLPITFGFIRPTVLFPVAAADWPHDRLRLVLAHELAHVRRLDCLTQLLAEAACAVYWFHPLAWFAASQLHKERERACDDAVLNQGAKSSDYAEHLLGVVKSAQFKGAPVTMAISIHSHNLQERLKAVLKPQMNRRSASPKLVAAIALVALGIALPVALVRAQSSDSTALAGTVYDASHAVVPNAAVTAIGLDTHNKEVAYTDAVGAFSFRSLPAGRYMIEVRSKGFALLQRQVQVAAGQSAPLNLDMEVGGVAENIDVIGQKPAPSSTPAAHAPQRIKVGGNVQPTKLVYRVPPVYPEHAKQSGLQGVVVLQAVIGTNGSLLSVEPVSKSVDPELVQAARDAVSQWRYEPVLLNGEPVEAVTTITVNFKLE